MDGLIDSVEFDARNFISLAFAIHRFVAKRLNTD